MGIKMSPLEIAKQVLSGKRIGVTVTDNALLAKEVIRLTEREKYLHGVIERINETKDDIQIDRACMREAFLLIIKQFLEMRPIPIMVVKEWLNKYGDEK